MFPLTIGGGNPRCFGIGSPKSIHSGEPGVHLFIC
jgi:hypothetical protein